MGLIQPVHRQSNINLSLQAHGSLDNIVAFCKTNGVRSLNVPLTISYIVNDNDIINRNWVGYPYATRFIPKTVNVGNYISQNGANLIDQTNNNYITQG